MSNEEVPPAPRPAPAKTSRLAVVIIVLLVSVCFLFYILNYLAHRQAPGANCRSNLKQIGLAVGMYQADHDEAMPPNFQTLVDNDYIRGVAILHCPSDPAPPVDAANVDASASYYYARVTDALNLESGPGVPIAWEKKLWHGPELVNVLFADLHVKSLETADLEKRLQLYRDLYD